MGAPSNESVRQGPSGVEGYTCEKALRLDYYKTVAVSDVEPAAPTPRRNLRGDRLGTAIREVAERLGAVRDTHGGDAIVYYAVVGRKPPRRHYGAARRAAGRPFKTNAIAQEKTARCWSWADVRHTVARVTSSIARSRSFQARTRDQPRDPPRPPTLKASPPIPIGRWS